MRVRATDALLAGIVCVLAGCGESPSAAHTVDYYRAHAQERRARVKDCVNDPGSRGRTPDCINALEADRLEGIGSFKDLPPMELPVPEQPKQ